MSEEKQEVVVEMATIPLKKLEGYISTNINLQNVLNEANRIGKLLYDEVDQETRDRLDIKFIEPEPKG